jgi:hypothetical protein
MKRQCELSMSIEAQDGSEKWLTLGFQEVQAYRCTHLASLGAISPDLLTQSYGQLISIDDSSWLRQVREAYERHESARGRTPQLLQHLLLSFDDGPLFEFICAKYTTPEDGTSDATP